MNPEPTPQAEPLPCPFCGKAATHFQYLPHGNINGEVHHDASCRNPECILPGRRYSLKGWNRRAPVAPVAGEAGKVYYPCADGRMRAYEDHEIRKESWVPETELAALRERLAQAEGERDGLQLLVMALRHAMVSQAERILVALSEHTATPQEGYKDSIEWATSDILRCLRAIAKERDRAQKEAQWAKSKLKQIAGNDENQLALLMSGVTEERQSEKQALAACQSQLAAVSEALAAILGVIPRIPAVTLRSMRDPGQTTARDEGESVEQWATRALAMELQILHGIEVKQAQAALSAPQTEPQGKVAPTDGQMLDWLEANCPSRTDGDKISFTLERYAPSLRAAIAAAMGAQKGEA